MPILKLNDAEIYYETHGKGKPLILIAGYTCDHLFWNLMLPELINHYQVITFDNRGVGQTKDSGGDITLETMANDTLALIESLGLIKPNILGQSMGGAIAQTIARKNSSKLNKLIILNSAAKFNARTILAIKNLLNLREENISLDYLVNAGLPWFFSSDYLRDPKNILMFKENLLNQQYPQSINDQKRQLEALQTFDSRKWLH